MESECFFNTLRSLNQRTSEVWLSAFADVHLLVPICRQCIDYLPFNGIVRQIYASVLVSINLSKEFENALSNEVADCFATHAPRGMKKAITSALAMAAKDGRRSLVPEDIPSARSGRQLGFH